MAKCSICGQFKETMRYIQTKKGSRGIYICDDCKKKLTGESTEEAKSR